MKFLKIAKEHQAEIRRMLDLHEGTSTLSYSQAIAKGLTKPFTMRLPVDVIAKLEVIRQSGLWSSKQDLAYDMVLSAIDDFYNEASPDIQVALNDEGKKALNSLNLIDKATSIYESDGLDSFVTKDEFIKDYERKHNPEVV